MHVLFLEVKNQTICKVGKTTFEVTSFTSLYYFLLEHPVEKDINDIFSDLLCAEDQLISEGFEEGYKKTLQNENIEAYHLGYHRGAELGAELGYYAGIVEECLSNYQNKNECSDKVLRSLESLQQKIASFPTENTESVDILALFENIRTHYKKVCAQLKLNAPFPETDQFSF